jgi:hypothetical protein
MRPSCPNKQTFTPPTGGNRPSIGTQASRGRNPGDNKGKPYGKLNYTSVAEVIHREEAVLGTLNIMTYPGKVLFDTGATTSFISKEFIDAYGLKCKPLDRPITILSAGGMVLVTQQRLKQVLMICGYGYYADLFVIPMSDIAIILGMDWLVSHGAQIDCGTNTITLMTPVGEKNVYQGDLKRSLRGRTTVECSEREQNRGYTGGKIISGCISTRVTRNAT